MPRPQPNRPNLVVMDLDNGVVTPIVGAKGGRGTSKRPNSKIGDFAMIHLDHTRRLYGLTGTQRDVLDAITRLMIPEKPFRYTAKEVALELGKDQAVVSRAQKVLRERGILIDLPDGRSILDPRIFWVGNRDKIPHMVEELRAAGLLLESTTTEGAPA